MEEINFLKINVSTYLPGLIKILGENNIDWDIIDDLFWQEHTKRIEKFEQQNSETILVEATIYDIIVEVKKENKQAKGLLDFLNKVMYELDLNLTSEEKKLIIPNIKNILTALDRRYLDFTAEIAVLNNLIKSKTYKLVSVEERLLNKKSIDFKLKRTSDNKFQLVEIVSIHLNSERIDSNESLIKKFLSDRLLQKINKKKKGLTVYIRFYLVPVLWGSWQDLKVYSDYFQKNKMHIKNVVEPVSYLSFTDPNDESFYFHRFGNVSHLFKDE